jgi:G2/mitotic-specific cyclin 1/2
MRDVLAKSVQPVTSTSVQPLVSQSGEFSETRLEMVGQEMERRRREWVKAYKGGLDLNDVLELRNPQSVIEFIPEIVTNMRREEQRHLYPSGFLERGQQAEISEKYRQYLVDWLAELHYKFKMWAETLFVTVGIIDKTLMRWRDFQKADLQLLGITALHIAGKYEEIYPPELKTILEIIENAVTRENVCRLEA